MCFSAKRKGVFPRDKGRGRSKIQKEKLKKKGYTLNIKNPEKKERIKSDDSMVFHLFSLEGKFRYIKRRRGGEGGENSFSL